MPPTTMLLILALLAYLAGSIPFGLLVGLSRGVDVRKAGSGNIGATNVARLLGTRYFALVFLLDMLKGLLPMLAAGRLIQGVDAVEAAIYALWLLVGAAAIAGHMFSIFIGFRGGKGVATSAGVVLGLFPYYTLPAAAALALWIVVFAVTRYVSLASIIAAVSLPVGYAAGGLWFGWDILGTQLPLLVFALLMATMVVLRHRSNITRLRAGTEPRFSRGQRL